MNLHRRLWITSMAAGGLALSRARLTQAEPCGQSSTDVSALLRLRVRPGYLYELRPVQPDSVRVGTRWRGDILPVADPQKAGQAPGPISPLEPMFRKRFIIKVDDVATWSLDDFQRFARFIEANDAKADLGIIPGRCGPEAFSWVRNLDPERFDIWNHTWSHGEGGVPNHYRQPYDVQCRTLEMAHRKVLEETGITMRGFCGGGIKYQGQPVHDQDDATHWIVRNHADYRVHFHADAAFADRGYGKINSDGIFMPWRFSWFENEGLSETQSPALVAQLRQRWPDLDWNRLNALGNAEELQWRFDHPFWNVPASGQIDSTVAQFHPWLWKDAELAALKQLLDYIRAKGDWQFAHAYETYKWLRDKQDLVMTKNSDQSYLLDASALRYEHQLTLRLPQDTRSSTRIYRSGV